ncbi:MAG: hypothetical protein E6I66_02170 [Chloroflexi bacterium]|nr:MAG: hypothetical protein E6I66_02170 [Chloroflexota bacterium]
MIRRALVIGAALLLVSCGTRLEDEQGGAGTGREAVRPSEPTIAYIQVGADPIVREDRPAYLRFPGDAPVRLGDGQQFATAGPETVLFERFDGHVQAYHVARAPTLIYERMNQGGPPRGIAFGDEIYEIQHGRLMATNGHGATREVSVPPAIPGPSVSCGYEKSIVLDPKASVVWGLATIGAHLFAFSATPANGAVFDLTDGRRLDLLGSGPAIAMAAGTDGKLDAITAEQECGSHQLIVRRIDPITMREEASIVTARTFPFDRIELVSSTAGTTYAHLVTATGAEFLRVDTRSVTPVALPPDSGLMTSAAPDGSIWLFGGRARNALSRFDPATGRVDRVPAADAPDGAFVDAVVFPSVGDGR